MKRILGIIICSILIASILVSAKIAITPVLLKNANYGSKALEHIGEVDNLFMGSSMFKQGIDIQTMNKGKDKSFLLSHNGNQPFTIYLELKKIIDAGVKIDTLFVDMYAYTVTATAKLSDTKLVQDKPISFMLDVYNTMHQDGNADIGDLFEMVVKANNEMLVTWPISYTLTNEGIINGGGLDKKSGATEERLGKLSSKFGNNNLNTTQTESLEKIIMLCDENDIRVIFVETPKYFSVYQNESYVRIMKDYSEFLDKYNCVQILSDQTVCECGIRVDEKHIVYQFNNKNADNFFDLIHMSYNGKTSFSAQLKEIVNGLNE